jgi:ribosomal-protein-alanine N-acetyltransferase
MNAILDAYRANTPPALAYRPMTAHDVDAVIATERALHPFPWTPGNFRDALGAGNACWLAYREDAFAGYGVMLVAAGEAHLLNLGVAPAWQRQGIGRCLLQFLMAEARKGDAQIMYLEVRPSNRPALALYASMGFAEVGRRKRYYPCRDGREDALVMTLPL